MKLRLLSFQPGFWALGLVLATGVACTNHAEKPAQIVGKDSMQIRPISEAEALSDYDSMIASIRSL